LSKLVGAKLNISKEETEGDSARCGAGDAGAKKAARNRGSLCLERKGIRSFAWRNAWEPNATRGNPDRDLARVEQEWLTAGGGRKSEVPHQTPPLRQSQRARCGEDLELDGLKQGLGEKSADLRRLNEEWPQAREAARNANLNSKDVQREPE